MKSNEKKEFLKRAIAQEDFGTGALQVAQNLMNAPGDDEAKVEYYFKMFEGTRAKWPPMSRDGSIKPDCKKGCAYCCHLNVDVLSIEMNYIWKRVIKYLTPEQLIDIKKQARINYEVKNKLNYENRLLSRQPCAFLDKSTKSCMIYEDRPLSCRGMYSGDVKMCEEGMKGSHDNMFWGPPYMLSKDMASGAALAIALKDENWGNGPDSVCTQLETGILRQDNPNIKDYEL